MVAISDEKYSFPNIQNRKRSASLVPFSRRSPKRSRSQDLTIRLVLS